MTSGRIRPGNRFKWTHVLSILMFIAAACTGESGGVIVTASREAERSATPSSTVTTAPPATFTPTVKILPSATLDSPESSPTQPPVIPTPPDGPLSWEALVTALRNGGYILYFRHAETDPLPDDAIPVVLEDCNTQRNLSDAGEAQAAAIGEAIERLEIPIGKVLSSPFCRALDTARLAFGRAESEPALENLETSASEAERQSRVEALQKLLSNPPQPATNDVLVGHGFNISAAEDVSLAEGEAGIFLPGEGGSFTLVATVEAQEWGTLP